MKSITLVFTWVLLLSVSLCAQVTLPAKVSAELVLIADPRISTAIEQARFRDSVEMLVKDLKPVSEGKFRDLDGKHKVYVSKIRMLRLILKKDVYLGTAQSKSIYKEMFPGSKIRSFWLWMSRDEYFFPSIHDQARLINKWKKEVSRSNVEAVDWNIDINEWWF